MRAPQTVGNSYFPKRRKTVVDNQANGLLCVFVFCFCLRENLTELNWHLSKEEETTKAVLWTLSK